MHHDHKAAIIISPYRNVSEILQRKNVTHVVSILGVSDKLPWPSAGSRQILQLTFDDVIYTSGSFVAARREEISDLIEFSRQWNGSGTLLVHCRAAVSRSAAGAMIAAGALAGSDYAGLVTEVATARSYFRPNETMLRHADDLFEVKPGLVELIRSLRRPVRTDEWGPVTIPIR
jgi:predicted protein tyrosine phosphatase